ncbi:hypothetical protein HIM_00286 [Hirsutella minnesotensis 3608]|nr:hypothetical protein HIM_00286 [Hirsutella minnesotensis 3608]
MGSGAARVREINSLNGPRNTLHCQNETSTSLHDIRPQKRQKPDGPAMMGKSRYFPSPEQSTSKTTFDLTNPEAMGAPIAENTSKATVPEFRTSSSFTKYHKPRKRKKRAQSGSQHGPQSCDRGSSISDIVSLCGADQSPDILSSDDHPPRADVVSDVHSQPVVKSVTDMTGPPFRNRHSQKTPENISDDELLHDPARREKRPHNFSTLRQPRSGEQAKGDIQQTVFKNDKQLSSETVQDPAPMALKRAVCGSQIYESIEGENNQIVLQPSASFEVVVPVMADGGEASQQWLRIDTKKILKYHGTSGGGPYVMIRRSMTHGTGNDGTLWLEFTSPHGASTLASMMSNKEAEIEDRPSMGKKIGVALQRARERHESGRAIEKSKEIKRAEVPWRTASGAQAEVEGPALPRPKLKDKLLASVTPSESQPIPLSDEPGVSGRSLRSRREDNPGSTPTAREPSPIRWTGQNPNWRHGWQRSLVFPATGKNRATVDDDDIVRLDEGEFLNDNLISFYLRYLQVKLENERPEVLKKVYIFSTFFFEKLRSTKGKINYEGVKSWTSKFDLFSYDYILVPVNERAHWYLTIICNVPNALKGIPTLAEDEVLDVTQDIKMLDASPQGLPATTIEPNLSNVRSRTPSGASPQKIDPRQPRIITLDSLGSSHPATCRALKDYLAEEARDKKGADLTLIPNGMKAKEVPEQNNFCDCGVFVLSYVEEFLKDPDTVARKLLLKEDLGWSIQPSTLRNDIRGLLFHLQEEQHLRLEKEKDEKRNKKKDKADEIRIRPSTEVRPPSPDTLPPKLGHSNDARNPPAERNVTPVDLEKSNGNEVTIAERHSPLPPPDDDEVVLMDNPRMNPNQSVSPPNEAFFSAQSSPKGLPPRKQVPTPAPVESAPFMHRALKPGSDMDPIPIIDDNPKLMSILSSSPPTPVPDNTRKSRRQREPSLELIQQTSHITSAPLRRPGSGVDTPMRALRPTSRPLISIEDSPKGSKAGYGGIDRS